MVHKSFGGGHHFQKLKGRIFMRKLCPFVFVAFLVAGCAAYHHGTDLSSLEQTPIVKGQTTEKELIARFGEPQNQTIRSDGKKMLMWSDANSSVPFMGIGATHVKSRTLSAMCLDGVVVDFTDSSGGY
jgi:hypothetical protein